MCSLSTTEIQRCCATNNPLYDTVNSELENFKKTIEENNSLYESMLDKTTQSLEKIISNTESLSKIQ